MSSGVTFPEFVAAMRPLAVIFPDSEPPVLTASEMIDQSALFRDIFGGRWPHMG